MLTLTHRLPADPDAIVQGMLALSADERMQSRQQVTLMDGQPVALRLPRGTVLRHGDLLRSSDAPAAPEPWIVRVIAKPEPVLTVKADQSRMLLRAAYHLGNRHVPLEVHETYLRLAPDPVLQAMLDHLGLQVIQEVQPFEPEAGAYGHAH